MKNKKYLIGIDEAGLGPVFGPLVVAGVVVKQKNLVKLKKFGAKDSKLFGSTEQSRIRRKRIWNEVKPLIKNCQYKIISAEELDKNNMYNLEIAAVAKILLKLNWRTAKAIYIDQLGQTSKKRFLEKLQKREESLSLLSELTPKLIYEKGADFKYIPTSLASIIAKVIRDNEVEQLCQKIGESYISGYPNRKTEEFLKKYFKKHHVLPLSIRRNRRWPPLRKLISEELKDRK